MRSRSLRVRIVLSMLAFAALLGAAILIEGHAVNEDMEMLMWRAVLNAELDGFLQRRAQEPKAERPASSTLRTYEGRRDVPGALPEVLVRLPAGVHDDVVIDDREYAVSIRDAGDRRLVVAMDITRLEDAERETFTVLVAALTAFALALVVSLWFIAGRAIAPITDLVRRLDRLEPAARRRLESPYREREIVAIAKATNGFLARLDAFIERERQFADAASHELRTPIAVIAGATDVLEARSDLPPAALAPLRRIRDSVTAMDDIAAAMLFLSREPSRTQRHERFPLDDLLASLCVSHAVRASEKGTVLLGPMESTTIEAPQRVAVVALDNLIRNSVEHGGPGQTLVTLEQGIVRITGPRGSDDPDELARVYAELAREGTPRPAGAGVGLMLLQRICERLRWHLTYSGDEHGGITAALDVRGSVIGG